MLAQENVYLRENLRENECRAREEVLRFMTRRPGCRVPMKEIVNHLMIRIGNRRGVARVLKDLGVTTFTDEDEGCINFSFKTEPHLRYEIDPDLSVVLNISEVKGWLG